MSEQTIQRREVTIANGASLSGAAHLIEKTFIGIEMPAGWTTAALTFQTSSDGVTYQDFYDSDNTEVTIASAGVAASRNIGFTDSLLVLFHGVRYVKVRSGTTASEVNQAEARTLILIAQRV